MQTLELEQKVQKLECTIMLLLNMLRSAQAMQSKDIDILEMLLSESAKKK